eukprot:scaffold37468_cov66-Phaeocystis_antarctica.AAC.5
MRPRTIWSATSACSGPATGERKRAAQPEGAGNRRCSSGWTGSAHRKARRRKRSAAPPPTAAAAAPPDVLCSTVCAIVPLYPNDDTPPERSKFSSCTVPRIGASCTGQRAICSAPRVAAATIGLRTRSCALPAAVPRDKRSSMRARPASPAAGSRWPMLALTLPTAASGSDLPSAPFKRSI